MTTNKGVDLELITIPEIARRVVAAGWDPSLSRQRVAKLAETDPAWPVPHSEWTRAGRYWLIPWDERLQNFSRPRP